MYLFWCSKARIGKALSIHGGTCQPEQYMGTVHRSFHTLRGVKRANGEEREKSARATLFISYPPPPTSVPVRFQKKPAALIWLALWTMI